MARIIDLATLAKTSVDSNDYFVVSNTSGNVSRKINVSSIFASLVTAGTGGEDIWSSITNKNQLNFKGIKSGDTGLLTVATTDNNIVLTALESGIDLSKCNNEKSAFLTGMNFKSTISGQCPVTSGGTGLATIAKGAMLYASATDTIAATAAMSTNGQLLIGNATNGYPSVATLTAGTGMTITNGAGTITLAASLTTMAADLDMDNNNIDLGTGYISADGTTDQGIRVTGANAYVGATANYHNSDVLNLSGGGIRFSNTASVTIKPNATESGTAGQPVTIESGSSASGNAGDLSLKGGTAASGSGNGGHVLLVAGSEAGGTAGSIKNSVYNGSGSAVQALTVAGGSANPDVTVDKGNLIITEAAKGIVHTGSGTITQITNHSTGVELNTTSGVITLANVALAAAAEADFKVDNDTVQAESVILLTVQSNAASSATNNASLHAELDEVQDNYFNVRLTNPGAGDTTGIHKIHFLVINPAIS